MIIFSITIIFLIFNTILVTLSLCRGSALSDRQMEKILYRETKK
ncbi:hypothetical protein ACSXBQ_17180 (plasmid) [Clostridium perfringens]